MRNDKYEMIKEGSMYRIKALKDFSCIEKGELGGLIEKESNLSVSGNAWVYENAKVYENAWVFGNAWVSGNASVYGNARVSGNAWVSGDARVSGNAWVCGEIKLEFGWCFGRRRENWEVTEVRNENEILFIKDYKPAIEEEIKGIKIRTEQKI